MGMNGGTRIYRNQGSFGDYIIDGELWRNPDDSTSWRMIVTSLPSEPPSAMRINLACGVSIDNDDIQCVEVYRSFPDLEEVKTGSIVTNIAPSIKEAIQTAKKAWMEDHNFITIEKACEVYRTTPQVIDNLILEKKLWAIEWGKVRRISRYDLDKLPPDEFNGLYVV